MNLQHDPVAKTAMLIRKPAAEVFEAFVNPAVTSKFWFSKGSGRLEAGKKVRWDWEMYGLSIDVNVKAIEPNKRIVIEWGTRDETPTTVEWTFTARPDNTTFVSIANHGFRGDGDKIVEAAIDSASGFAFVLSGAKALLEHNVKLNLVPDHSPDGVSK